ncbi:AMP-binding protein [Nonomuraea ferruginea]
MRAVRPADGRGDGGPADAAARRGRRRPAEPVSRLPLLSAEESGWAEGPRRDADPEPLPHVFSGHVARTPDAPALVAGTATWTYAELDREANRIAHHLIAAGAGPESVVALALPRSAELIAAILGVLKA